MNDEDYDGNVLTVLRQIAEYQPQGLPIIEAYLDGEFSRRRHLHFCKAVRAQNHFRTECFSSARRLCLFLHFAAVMMPLTAELTPTYEVIKRACAATSLRCLRVDDIWEESAIIQDIFNSNFRAQIVIVDFTGKNANVMYETGIAHTLGKHVVPITQSMDDVPFDMKHHRVLKYLPNEQGLATLQTELVKKLQQYSLKVASTPASVSTEIDDGIPF